MIVSPARRESLRVEQGVMTSDPLLYRHLTHRTTYGSGFGISNTKQVTKLTSVSNRAPIEIESDDAESDDAESDDAASLTSLPSSIIN